MKAKQEEGELEFWHGIIYHRSAWQLCAASVEVSQVKVGKGLLDEYEWISQTQGQISTFKLLKFSYGYRDGVLQPEYVKEDKGAWVGASGSMQQDYKILVNPTEEEKAKAWWLAEKEMLMLWEWKGRFVQMQKVLAGLPRFAWDARRALMVSDRRK